MPFFHGCDVAEYDAVYPGITLLVIQIITDKYTQVLQNDHFINNIRNSSMFETLKGHLQRV
jgi:hypothetical protein